MALPFEPRGVMPATLLAFDEALRIDEADTRRHLRDVASVKGVTAITVNGHASEVSSCSFEERRQLLDIAVKEVGADVPLISGVYADNAEEGIRAARMAEETGASALLVFPPQALAPNGFTSTAAAIDFFGRIAEATALPNILFHYPRSSGLGLAPQDLMALLRAVPGIVAIKDYSSDGSTHEHLVQSLPALERPVAVLTTHSSWLLGSLAMGPVGLLSGAGSVIADLQAELLAAVEANDLRAAQTVNKRIYILNQVFYRAPFADMHNRMKNALVLLGRQKRALVRSPLMKLGADEVAQIGSALTAAGYALAR